MSRSEWKAPFSHLSSIKPMKGVNQSDQVSRSSKIMPNYLGQPFKIHNGKTLVELTVSENMVGHKFGEFAFTRSKYVFKSKKNKKRAKKNKKK